MHKKSQLVAHYLEDWPIRHDANHHYGLQTQLNQMLAFHELEPSSASYLDHRLHNRPVYCHSSSWSEEQRLLESDIA
ncbi:hypothetical protein D9M71_486850 [compost metagenome]